MRVNLFTLTYRYLLHQPLACLGVAMAAAVATAAIVGALLVGDSIRATLRHIALERLGDTQLAMHTGERFFTGEFLHSLRRDETAGDPPIAAALQLPATAAAADADRYAAGIQLYGIDAAFLKLLNAESGIHPPDRQGVLLNERLAGQLDASVGDSLLFRIAKPSALSREIPLGSDPADSITLRLSVQGIVPDDAGGRFSLRAEQIPPLNAFVDVRTLAERADRTDRFNLLLVGKSDTAADADQWRKRLQLALADAGLRLREDESAGLLDLQSERVFMDDAIVQSLTTLPEPLRNYAPALTYFVNDLSHGDRSTPYSMVTGFDPARSDLLPDDMADDQIVLTQWLAEDLQAKAGDRITLKYYRLGDSRLLVEQSAEFTVLAIVPTEPPGGDRQLMPDFPGMTDAASPLDWDPPADLNIDLGRIRKSDEQYWEEHRGAPKAFVTLAWAQRQWGTRFGQVTSVRWQRGGSIEPAALADAIASRIDPASIGFVIRDVRTPALAASQQGYDFGGLFIGFSFFVIVAALVLTALMFAFTIEQRSPQVGLMLSLGFTPGRVRRVLMLEGAMLATIGLAIGVPLGIGYTQGVLWALANWWHDAIGLQSLRFDAKVGSIVGGAAGGWIVAMLAMLWILRKQAQQPARKLLASRFGIDSPAPRKGNRNLYIVGGLTGATLALGISVPESQMAPAFFGIGAMLLICGIVIADSLLRRKPGRRSSLPTLGSVGWANATRCRGRSLATVTMLAVGTFLLVAINAFRHDPNHAPESATFGYELFAQTTLPVSHDLNSIGGREYFTLDDAAMKDVQVVPMRLREGDDASCLNLNRPQSPPVLGVDASQLPGDAWEPLRRSDGAPADDRVLPGLIDQAVAQWVLHVGVGDRIEMLDEQGKRYAIEVAGLLPKSILQGYLIIREEDFKRVYPGSEGYRVFLVDVPEQRTIETARELERAMRDVGLSTMSTAERLAMFNRVENTYLTIFSVLGGLGVLLGCVGLGLVVLRNALERRAELAAMRAIGFEDSSIRSLVLAEHGALVAVGLCSGVLAAAVAVYPVMVRLGAEVPRWTLVVIITSIAVAALLWTVAAARIATRGRLIASLRSE